MARILLGVSGGIAAYRALELARLATKAGHGVRVLMTPSAMRFVGPASFEGIVGAPVLVEEWKRDPMRGTYPGEPAPEHDPIGHLALAERADAFLVAPASANTLAKLASGMADSMVTTSFLACTAPRLVAPAMNDRMYRDGATQRNLELLRERDVTVIDPDVGQLASRGEFGAGRLPQPDVLLQRIEQELPKAGGSWDGLRVVVTAGGTREPIDSVRFIGNRSSGRMGIALAEAAARRGATVTLVAANVNLTVDPRVEVVAVETTAELAQAAAEAFAESHVVLMAAAVADFRPESEHGGKLARDGQVELRLTQTEDVIAGLAANRTAGQTIVGFAAEHGPEAISRAREKLARKGLDAIVFNDISRSDIGFDAGQNEVTIVTGNSETEVPLASKGDVAEAILNAVGELRGVSTIRG